MKRRKITSGSKKERLIHEKSRSLLEKGNECLAKGKNEEAIAYYNQAIDYLEPYKDDLSFYRAFISGLYKNLGQALVKVNRRNDALRIFDKVLQLEPKNVDIWVSRGEVLVFLSSTMQEEAMRSFDSALNIEPTDKRALGSKGEAFERVNIPEKAKECYLRIIDFYPEELEFYDRILRLTPEDKSIWLRKGQILDQKERYEEALFCYDRALEIDPNDKKLWSSRALSLGKLERYDEAAKSFQKGIELDDKDKSLWKGLGSMLHANGILKEALEAYENAIKLDDTDKELWNKKGLALFEMGNPQEALNAHENALKLAPDDISILNNKKEALKALERREDVITVCDKILELEPKNIQALNEKGSILLFLREFEKAIEIFDKALALDPRDLKVLTSKKQAYKNLKHLDKVLETCGTIVEFYPEELDAWIDSGVALEELGQVDKALFSYDKALKIEPENLDILLKKKNALKRLNKDEEIIGTCDLILNLEPKNSEALDDKGASLVNLARNEEAIEIFETLFELDPKNTAAIYKKGVALSRIDAYEEAIKCYDEALNLDPDSKEALENKGDALNHLENFEGAVDCYDKALKLDENDAQLWDKRGKILLDSERYGEVLVSYEKALAIDPKNPRYLYLKGFSLDKLKRYEEALESFDSSLDLDERYEEALLGKGLVLVRMGRESEALGTLNKVLEVNPDNLESLISKRDVFMKLENYEEAETTCDRILKLAPNDAKTWEDKAYALTKLGNESAAVPAYDKALDLEPENLKLWALKKEPLKLLRKHEDVIYASEKILEHEPKNIEALKDKGEALENLDRNEEAIEVYNHVLDSYPKDIVALHKKGRALSRLEQYEASLKCYDEALGLEEKEKMLWNDKGILLTKMEDHENAIKCFDNALKLDAEDDNILTNKALALYRAGMYDEALDAFNRVMELSRSKKEAGEGIKKGITVEIDVFRDIVLSLGEGDEKSRCLAFLSDAEEALDKDNYIMSHGYVVECKNIVKNYTRKAIEVTDAAISTLKEMEGDISEFEEMFGEVKSLPEDKNYSEVLSLSKKIIQEVNEQQHKLVSDMFTSMADDIDKVKDSGIDFSKQNKMLAEVEEAIKTKSFKKAYDIITQSKDEILELLEKHKELSEALGSLRNQLEEAEKKGVDMSAPLRKIEAIEKALEAQDFETVSKEIEECEGDIKQLMTLHSMQEKINQSEEFINIAKGLGIDTSDAELQQRKAVIYKKNEQFENALDIATKNAEKTEELCNLKVSEMLSSAYSMIIEAKKIGLEVLTVEVLYQKAEDALEARRYDKAAKYASQSLDEIEEIRDECQRAANITYLAGKHIQEAENINADISQAKKLLEKALSELRNNEYITTIELGKKCIGHAKKVKKQKVSESIDLFQSIVDNSKIEGKDVSEAEKLLEKAKIALASEDFMEALKLAVQSESEVGKADLQKKVVTEILDGITAKLEEAEKNGVGSERVRTLLTNSTNALENNHCVKALEYAMESGMELLEATEEYERASTTLQAAQARMKEGENLGVDAKNAKELFETAKKAYSESNYSSAMKFAKETIRKADRSYIEYLSGPIESCEQLIKTAEFLGVNVRRVNNLLSEAKTALRERFYLQVTSFTESCKKLVERDIKRNLFEKLYSGKAKLEKAKSEGMDITGAMVLLESAESSLESKAYMDAQNYYQKFLETLGTVKTEGLKAEEKPLGVQELKRNRNGE